MAKTDDFCDYVVDLLSPLGAPRYRYMFGGYGIYLDDRIVAIVADGRLLLRADEVNRGDYEARGIPPFSPFADKPSATMPYYEVPADVFESDDFLDWAGRSRDAALRAQAAKEKKEREKEERRRSRPR